MRIKKFFMLKGIIISVILLCACVKNEGINNKEEKVEEAVKFARVILFSNEESTSKLLNLKEKNIEEIKDVKNLVDIKYTKDSLVKVEKFQINQGMEIRKNYLNVSYDKTEKKLDKYYAYKSFQLSKSGDYIAYIPYSTDEMGSILDLKVYDINKDKEISLPKEYVVSGDQYQLNDNFIYFYGVDLEKNISGIFKFNFLSKEVTVVKEGFETEVSKFFIVNDYLYYITSDLDNKLNIYNINDKAKKKSYNDMSNYFDYVIDGNDIYLIGADSFQNTEIYTITKDVVKKITYDFPTYIDKDGGIAYEGNYIYFLGQNEDNDKDIFVYDRKDGFVKTSNLSHENKIDKIFMEE